MKIFIVLLVLQTEGIIKKIDGMSLNSFTKAPKHVLRSTMGKLYCNRSEVNLEFTLFGGQTYRWKRNGDNSYIGVVNGRVWTLTQYNKYIEYKVTEMVEKKKRKKVPNYDKFIFNYLRLDENINELYANWSAGDKRFKELPRKYYGVRLLRQDILETLFSGICSSSIDERTPTMVEVLSKHFGEKICKIKGHVFYKFPTLSSLSGPNILEELKEDVLFGHRAKWIYGTASQLTNFGGMDWLDQLRNLSYPEAKRNLRLLFGVGDNVADTVCLMALNHMEAIPIDGKMFRVTKVFEQAFSKKKTLTKKTYQHISDFYKDLYKKYPGWGVLVRFLKERDFSSDEYNLLDSKEREKYY